MSGVEDKKYHSECEKISFLALVRLAHDNLRGHVTWSSNQCSVSAGAVASRKRAGKTEIDNFYVIIFVEENIIRLEITMRKAFMMDVMDTH